MHTSQTNNPVEFFSKNGVIYITLSGDVLTYNVEKDLQKNQRAGASRGP